MRRRDVVALIFLLMTVPVTSGEAAPLNELKTYSNLILWLRQTLQSVETLGAQIDKAKLINYLDDLGDSFEDMLLTKGKIIRALGEQPLDREKLKRLTDEMDKGVDETGESLKSVAFLLKQQERGDTIALNLRHSLDDKESWLTSLKHDTRFSDDQLANLSSQVTKSKEALAAANGELAVLVKVLKEQH